MNRKVETLAPWLFTIGLFAFWELACRLFNVSSIILPAPSEIYQATVRFWAPLMRTAFVTLGTTLAGFLMAVGFGLLLGLFVGWSRTIYRGL